MKVRDSSGSSDSSDIDLDEILKTIPTYDEIDRKLLSVNPYSSATRTTRIAAPKKDPVHGEKSDGKNDDDPEVLTSFSSNNGHGKSEGLGKSLSKNLERGSVAGIGGNFNTPARARRRNAKFGSEAESVTSSAVGGAKLASSNLDTGLWSGDDLWNLNVGKVSEIPGASKTSSMPASKSSNEGSKIKSVTSQPVSGETKGGRPGKYDWLGLLDDESEEEKGELMGNKDQKVSTVMKSSVSQEVKSRGRIESQSVSLSGINNDPSKVGKGSSVLSVEENIGGNVSQVVEPQGKSNRSSLSENLSPQKGSSKSSRSKSRRSGMTTKDEGKAANISEILKDDQIESLGQSKEGVGRAKFQGALDEGNVNKGEQFKAPVFPRRRSLLEEEEKSPRSYTPTFLGGSPEGPGRRRRKREGVEEVPRRPMLNPDFDPLDLFSIDDGPSKLEDSSKSKAKLPDWLTGLSTKMSTEKEKDSHIIRDDSTAEVKKDTDRQEVLKVEEKHTDLGPQEGLYGEKSEVVNSHSSSYLPKKLSQPEEKAKDVRDPSAVIMKNDMEQFQENIQGENDVSSSPHSSHINESEGDSEKLSRSASDESRKKRLAHKSSGTSRKEGAVSKKNSEVNEVFLKSEEKSPIRRKVKKDDEKSSKKQRRKNSPIIESKPKPKKKDRSGDMVSNEDGDFTSLSERSDSKTGQLLSLERQYRRKVKELEEKVKHTEHLEEELARMKFLEGEVEHLKAVVHVLELEKSAAEALVESLQARHSEQLKRLEDVHRNEVETLRKAALREEKRGAEEVKRLVVEHRKTLDRLMDANIKLEEEFRTRMLEARRDWGRDIEAMRVAYQQSNNAAITNASLAVLTGHSFGSETKGKGEDDARDESLTNAIPQCLQEVKELSQKVDRVESILAQSLELLMPKAKPQSDEVPVHEVETKVEEPGLVVESVRKPRVMPVRAKGRHRRGKARTLTKKTKNEVDQRKKKPSEESESSEQEEEDMEDQNHDIHSSVGAEDEEEVIRSDSGYKIRRHTQKKVVAEQKKDVVCGECKCCRGHSKGFGGHLCRSISAQDSYARWEKHDKEGRNMDFRLRDGGEHWRNRRKMFSWKDQMDHRNKHWSDKEDKKLHLPEPSHLSMSEGTGLDTNFISHLRQSFNVIIDPKEYLVRLATANASNLFQ